MVEAGAVAFSDDGAPVYDAELMRRAFEYCLMFDKPMLNHAEVRELTQRGVMHEGLVSLVLGLPGMPAAAEDVMTSRDIALAEATGGRLHIMHVSTAGSVDALRRAKRRGVRVTTEVTPHHFTLTDECLRTFDSNFKMNPPLRGQEHVEACIAGLADGTIDVIATDHAPHAKEKKMQELDQAPFGIVGLETSLGLVVTKLIEPGHLDWPTALGKMTHQPGPDPGHRQGNAADRRRRRRDDHRPEGPLDGRPGEVPLQEQQHALCRLGAERPGRHGDRRRPGEVPARGARDRATRSHKVKSDRKH